MVLSYIQPNTSGYSENCSVCVSWDNERIILEPLINVKVLKNLSLLGL